MKYTIFLFLLALFLFACGSKEQPSVINATPGNDESIINSDVHHFYEAFYSIQAAKDDDEASKMLHHLFLDKASKGQKAMIKARRYKAEEYLDAMKKYPKFFKSLHQNMKSTDAIRGDLDAVIQKFKAIYPNIKPAKIYFTVGAFRSNGTTQGDKVLIGSELALVDDQVDLSEFPEDYWAREYWSTNPIQNLLKLNIHEFVHTQQVENTNANLLIYCFREGVAEFVSDLAFNIDKQTSKEPSIIYGRENETKIIEAFTKDMFNKDFDYWLWSNKENPFGTRDLGYFVGYVIAEKYYNDSTNKQQAIKDIIEVDYKNEKEVEELIDKIGYFEKVLKEYR